MHVILEKDQQGVHIGFNDDCETLIEQRKENSPDHCVRRKNNVLIERYEIYGKKVNTHAMIEFLAGAITQDHYNVCSSNCQHFVEDLLDEIGLLKARLDFRIRTFCLTGGEGRTNF